MELHKGDLKHEDPAQDIIWEDDDLIIHLKEEATVGGIMIRLLNAHPAQVIFDELGRNATAETKITITKQLGQHT